MKIRGLSKYKVNNLLVVAVTLIQLHFVEYPEISWTEVAIVDDKPVTIHQAAILDPSQGDPLFPEVFLPELRTLRLPPTEIEVAVCIFFAIPHNPKLPLLRVNKN